jgi:hypothetical protein
MVTHDELTYCIQKKYPNLKQGVDFLVGAEIDPETNQQGKEAAIYFWFREDIPQPSEDELKELVQKYGDEAKSAVASYIARAQRDTLLAKTDGPFMKALESGDQEAMKEIGAVRQALRDLPLQEGFPQNIQWPEMPK